jgi:MIP family channel proteins
MGDSRRFQPRKYLAEMAGTFGIVFIGTGSIVLNDFTDGGITHPGVSAAFGLIVMAMIYLFGKISGSHFNPAVTLSLWLARKFERHQVLPYLVSQLLGAFLGSLLLRLLFPAALSLGETLPANDAVLGAFLLEFLMTFLLMFLVMLLVLDVIKKPNASGALIGSLIFLEALFGGPFSGASMNPARSIAPALVSGHIQHLWVYIAAPILGAFFAIALVMGTKENTSKTPKKS